MSPRDVEGIAALFKERRFAAGETITKQGAGGAAFFLIESGEAIVSIGGPRRATLTKGDYFGEMALIDEGARSATITASTALSGYAQPFHLGLPAVLSGNTPRGIRSCA